MSAALDATDWYDPPTQHTPSSQRSSGSSLSESPLPTSQFSNPAPSPVSPVQLNSKNRSPVTQPNNGFAVSAFRHPNSLYGNVNPASTGFSSNYPTTNYLTGLTDGQCFTSSQQMTVTSGMFDTYQNVSTAKSGFEACPYPPSHALSVYPPPISGISSSAGVVTNSQCSYTAPYASACNYATNVSYTNSTPGMDMLAEPHLALSTNPCNTHGNNAGTAHMDSFGVDTTSLHQKMMSAFCSSNGNEQYSTNNQNNPCAVSLPVSTGSFSTVVGQKVGTRSPTVPPATNNLSSSGSDTAAATISYASVVKSDNTIPAKDAYLSNKIDANKESNQVSNAAKASQSISKDGTSHPTKFQQSTVGRSGSGGQTAPKGQVVTKSQNSTKASTISSKTTHSGARNVRENRRGYAGVHDATATANSRSGNRRLDQERSDELWNRRLVKHGGQQKKGTKCEEFIRKRQAEAGDETISVIDLMYDYPESERFAESCERRCLLKVLASHSVVGAFYRANGLRFQSLQEQYDVEISVTTKRVHFPGSNNKGVLLFQGKLPNILKSLRPLYRAMQEESKKLLIDDIPEEIQPEPEWFKVEVEVVIPESLRFRMDRNREFHQVMIETGSNIRVIKQTFEEGLVQERVLVIFGTRLEVEMAVERVALLIQEQINTKNYAYMQYPDLTVAHGAYSSNSTNWSHEGGGINSKQGSGKVGDQHRERRSAQGMRHDYKWSADASREKFVEEIDESPPLTATSNN